jgi:hypothetical protein
MSKTHYITPTYNTRTDTYTIRTCVSEKTFTAQIFVGQRIGYSDIIIPIEEAENYLHEYCNSVGFCVTITPTKFIYKNVAAAGTPNKGEEPGFIVGIIQYPLYPMAESKLKERTEAIAIALKELYQQNKVTIVYPDETTTIN